MVDDRGHDREDEYPAGVDSPAESGTADRRDYYGELEDGRPICRILHPTDFSSGSEVAFAHALKLAALAGAELDLLHVSRREETVGWQEFPEVGATLDRWRAHDREGAGPTAAGSRLRVGKVVGVDADPVRSVVTYIGEHPTELIVLATHQRQGAERWVHRVTAEPIARRSHEATLFIPYGGPGFVSLETGAIALDRILIPIDQVPAPEPGVAAAVALLEGLERPAVSVILLHVGEERGMPMVRPQGPDTWRWERSVGEGDPVERILSAATEKEAQLIVMTTQGHHGLLDALRGSTTERVIRRAPCPVLAVPEGSRAMARLFFREERPPGAR